MVFIDTPKKYLYRGRAAYFSHMAATTLPELHEFANSIGLNKCWFQNKRGKRMPHYDVNKALYDKAIESGAIACTRSELFNMLKNNLLTHEHTN